MRSARLLLLAPLVLVAAAACHDHDYDYGGGGGSSIVFGISQGIDPATGETRTRAGYEFLELARKGGWVTHVMHEDRGTCIFERLDQRLGQPHVESGAAAFRGGSLPTGGLVIPANHDDYVVHAGEGWKTGDVLSFEASGFAMPEIHTQRMSAPAAELAIASPAEGELTLSANEDVTVRWTPIDESFPTRVMIALETEEPDGRAGEVRCFFPARESSATIPKLWIARLLSSVPAATATANDDGGTQDAGRGEAGATGTGTATGTAPVPVPVKGKLQIATHRQLTIFARGDWTIYVVATTMHREQPFTAPR